MFCKNCGNEIKENEKFCGKCGKKIINSKVYIILGIIFLLIFIICIFTFQPGKTKVISNNVANNLEKNQNQINNNLSVIDSENKEFKINAEELINEIINSDKSITEKNRELGGFEYSKKLVNSSTKYNTYSVRKFSNSRNTSRLSIFDS